MIPIVYELIPVRVDITQQNSLPQKFWITYSDINKDTEYILFIPPKSKYIESDAKYLKKISCKEGDYLTVKQRDYFCNNKYIGTASEFDGNMNKIEYFEFNGIIQNGKYFVIGSHPLSHDSKYFGFVDKSQILRKAEPLFKDLTNDN
jgi:conjugal transfer pilin signal peptidase TrbI